MTIQFQANFLLKGTITCETGLHIGGTSEGIEIGGLENIVIRDPKTDLPFIPGSSLKGKMRTLLELSYKDSSENIIKNKGEPCKCGKCIPCKIFGSSAPDNKSKDDDRQQGPTRLVVRDSFTTVVKLETELKSENTINRITSEANPRSMERVPRGTQFKFEMIFSIYEEEDYSNFLKLIDSMKLLEDSYLGGSGTRGYGQIQFKDIYVLKRPAGYYTSSAKEIEISNFGSLTDMPKDDEFLARIK
ncbi:type III-A CRISPR-associated RAMP protein Csm3 [Methanosarcina sp. Z-7115]|uniref:CRISPR system Cms endoribonuclease Csm3 n=1 Tax=Methanosarcina baikalica TaxID=3073890 RepID=A0ABU2D4D2_9EURY|nr:type III-A CRISPR-associated RAMP protein Csm3 [Methanosarcina sp. Z-7115]MDR7666820.1 type III-A CRISPR-associated RAMP protein Csm3 [Methanosarcina sp. Z-7115]